MSPKWPIFFFTLWAFGSLLGLILEGAYLGSEEASTFNTIMNFMVAVSTFQIGKVVSALLDLAFWSAIINMAFWNFSFWQEGPLAVVRFIFFLPISAGFLLCTAAVWVRGVGGGA